MKNGLMLLMLAVMLFPACADTNSHSRRDSMLDRANTCATCGATVSDGYFGESAYKAIGPGSY